MKKILLVVGLGLTILSCQKDEIELIAGDYNISLYGIY